MTRVYDTFQAGGFAMYPLLVLSVTTLSCILERSWFWLKLAVQEKQVVHRILTAAKVDFRQALDIAWDAEDMTVGTFLLAPLKLRNPSPESFKLAIAAASDREYAEMHRGDKLLETVALVAPLFGILGTIGGLLTTLLNLKGKNADPTSTSLVSLGINQALIAMSTGICLAIVALLFGRLCLFLRSRQKKYLSRVGDQLEEIYLNNLAD